MNYIPKFNIGDKVLFYAEVAAIHITSDGVQYFIKTKRNTTSFDYAYIEENQIEKRIT